MICPKCSYERKPIEHSPDSECPKCGIIYAKFNAPAPREPGKPKVQPDTTIAAKPASYTGMGTIMAAIVGPIIVNTPIGRGEHLPSITERFVFIIFMIALGRGLGMLADRWLTQKM